jgi:hypothetical protein
LKTRLLILIIILSVVSYVAFVETDNYFNGGLTELPQHNDKFDIAFDESDPVTLLEEIVAIEDCEKFDAKFDSWEGAYGLDENLDVPDELYNTGMRKAVDCTNSSVEP